MVRDSFIARVNDLFVPSLKLSLSHVNYICPAIWSDGTFRFSLVGKKIWDFPHDFMGDDTPYEQRLGNYGNRCYRDGQTMVESLCREYLDRPRNQLFEPFSGDHWGVIEILRAGDRRLGFRRLTLGALLMESNNEAARTVLATRFPPKDS